MTAADVPDSLKARWIAADGRARVEVLPTHDISDSRAMADFADAVLAVAPNATGAPVTVTEAARVVGSSFLEATALTLVLMVLLLVAVQRSVTGMVLILAPLILAALWTMATAGLLDIPFNFANVIVIPLLFALGVSSSIHMVTRGQDLVREGASDSAFGIELLVTSTPRAVLVSTLTTSTAFATLALSNHRGLSSMGVLLAVSITYTVISSLVVLPALMIVAPLAASSQTSSPGAVTDPMTSRPFHETATVAAGKRRPSSSSRISTPLGPSAATRVGAAAPPGQP
ncbi:MMPL family transporter [Azospirillum brasilense]|uniref:MMPL family transporter n=1 Tax=Azospirillum brasilense TaxID=192 RepID=UPI0003A98E1C|nr:MMPL family transporter [Azospirillum brasilense]